MQKFQKVKIPFNIFANGDVLILVDVDPLYEYAGGHRTDTVIGTKYTAVDTTHFNRLVVKVPIPTPKISKEALEASKDRIYVRFIDAYGKPYISNGIIDYTFNAADVEIVKKSSPSQTIERK